VADAKIGCLPARREGAPLTDSPQRLSERITRRDRASTIPALASRICKRIPRPWFVGAETLEWDAKTRCCGAGLAATVPEWALGLSRWLIDQAQAVGADCIAVACPSCHANLDGRQLQVADLVHKLPFAQLMALAFGAAPKAAGLHKNLVDPLPLLREKDMVEAN
jgi:hypothetical protein